MKSGFVRQALKDTPVSYGATTFGSTPTLFVGDGAVPVVVWSTEFVGASGPLPSATPMSQLSTGVASPGAPRPVTGCVRPGSRLGCPRRCC